MSLELQLAHCNICSGYYSSTVLNSKDLGSPAIIDHYFYHGEPWFTLDKKTFDLSVDRRSADVKVVNFEEHLKDDHKYCTCNNLTASFTTNKQMPTDDTDHDIYFYDLYITYNNFHQDLPARKAI